MSPSIADPDTGRGTLPAMRSRLPVGGLSIEPGGRVHLLVCDRAEPPVPAGSQEVSLERWTEIGRAPCRERVYATV